MPGESGLALLREHERNTSSRRRENIKLGGLITSAVGVGLMIFLGVMDTREPAYLLGLIPLLVGIALFAYVYLFAPKD
ncbi:MAG TPA: hypothetical protein VGG46_07930 [Terriglobales bacterium]|jgi:hypothetical protein